MKNGVIEFRKIILLGGVMILALIIAGAVTSADTYAATYPTATGTVSVSSATVRASYSTSSKIIKTLARGKQVSVSSEKYTSKTSRAAGYRWFYVPAYKGYIRSDMVTIKYQTVSAVTTAAVSVRYGPGESFRKCFSFAKGKTVTVVLKAYNAYGNRWLKIRYNGRYYYVYTAGIRLGTTAVATTSAAASKYPTATGTVKASSATIRSSYSTSSKARNYLSKGKTVSISSEKYTSRTSRAARYRWFYVPAYKGYIRSDMVSVKYQTVSAVTTTGVSVRYGPGTAFKKCYSFAKGRQVTVVLKAYNKYKNLWYKIKYDGRYYYIHSSYLKLGTTSGSGSGSTGGNTTTSTTDYGQYLINQGFPSSYTAKLTELHNAHPNWVFKPVKTNLDWYQAVSNMTSNSGANTIYTSYAPSYRSTLQGCYNYLTDKYYGKDGSYFVAASTKAVRYYMDPRNWLDETNVFMFEDQSYKPSYQTIGLVQKIIQSNTTLYNNAGDFITAGSKYNISPVYLAAKAYTELGTTTYTISGTKIMVNGTATPAYNVYNIGAADSAAGNAAYNGLVYAVSGTTYGRPWNTLTKAIVGGAGYIASNFISNNQNSRYLEHFNVMNGLSNVGTHVYMTAVYAPKSQAYATVNQYKDFDIMGQPFEFYIPVYNNMPAGTYGQPSTSYSKDNNMYLKTLQVKYGSSTYTPVSSSAMNFNTSFSKTVSNSVSSITIDAVKASTTAATVTGTGTRSLKVGTNVFYVKCTSSSGTYYRDYKITITRSAN